MTKRGFAVTSALVFLFLCSPIFSQAGDDLVQNVVDGCKTELDTYCKDVTPGEGRVLACLYAHNDKLSGRCEYALYDAAAQLERAVAALSYVVNECRDDLVKLCGDVPAGEGRLVECLAKNEKMVSERCKQAIKDVE
ncbi:MAG: cysteine rich repeat-containing protein [Proteobacteria bacterium]|nr:cysteine rich repeat-containing protein [Pseudomonadota bacterium]MBU1419077.1 cysteine rich repeat-containing protein [Pseudomonadota bacterium]MBU1453944.1 cysteine rich repeat-containing protein [Pseudomonadota bacterium]